MIAKMLKEELEWDNTLHSTKDKLSQLAEEAIAEHQSGKTKK
jgi:hypothetical protein